MFIYKNIYIYIIIIFFSLRFKVKSNNSEIVFHTLNKINLELFIIVHFLMFIK